jgi:hypothetical protein
MQLKLQQIITAAPALRKLGEAELSLKTAYQFRKIQQLIDAELLFYADREKLILDKYGTPTDETGKYTFADNDAREQALLELDELLKLEVLLDFDTLEISLDEDIRLSANDITALEPIITFADVEVPQIN